MLAPGVVVRAVIAELKATDRSLASLKAHQQQISDDLKELNKQLIETQRKFSELTVWLMENDHVPSSH